MQGVLEKGVKVAKTIAVLKNPLTWILAGILPFLISIFRIALFISISLGGENQFEGGMSGEESGGTAKVSADVLRYEPLFRNYGHRNLPPLPSFVPLFDKEFTKLRQLFTNKKLLLLQ
ncbi:hypothetical protein RCG19_12005 [Neobacillus sp. OS1-2]|uniref:hypothetical protein n=1 Tax=Neobacillus sp. OS1-2 TaxID=3070680 RepID=UPI0027DEB2A5|nr:hypothetical protein [Neobacillus sp. OS1-2]WML37972.1 hypothetical protein RCG19_12005 [Neobacillus sp. OS1-2]